MTKYQAGVGPSMTNLHIYEIRPDDPRNRLSLCQSTNVARNYKGVVAMENTKLCRRCFSMLQKSLPAGAGISAELIGVHAIE